MKTASDRENADGRRMIAGAWAAVFISIAAVPLAGLLPGAASVIASCAALGGFLAALVFAVGRQGAAVAERSGDVGELPVAPPGPGDLDGRGASRSRGPATAVGVTVVAAAAVALASALGGSAAHERAARGSTAKAPVASGSSSPGSSTRFRSSVFTALVPTAWRIHDLTEQRSGETAGFADPRVLEFHVAAYVFRSKDAAAVRARAIEQRVRRHPGYRRLFRGLVALTGGPRAWRLDYTVGDRGYVVYTFSRCSAGRLVIVLGQAPLASLRRLESQVNVFASSVRPFCP